MEHVPSKDQFWNLAPAAERIFGHVERDPELRSMELDFDYGLIDGTKGDNRYGPSPKAVGGAPPLALD